VDRKNGPDRLAIRNKFCSIINIANIETVILVLNEDFVNRFISIVKFCFFSCFFISSVILADTYHSKVVSCGDRHCIAISSEGTIYGWGMNTEVAQDGNNVENTGHPKNLFPESNLRFTAVATGSNHNLAIDENGKLWAWGENNYGQLGLGNEDNTILAPTEVIFSTPVLSISAHKNSSIAVLEDGSVWQWGSIHRLNLHSPGKVQNLPEVVSASVGSGFAFAVDSSGGLWAWGFSVPGLIAGSNQPVKVEDLPPITKVVSDLNYALALDENNDLWGFGSIRSLSGNKRSEKRLLSMAKKVSEISTHNQWAVGITSEGKTRIWGEGCAGLWEKGPNDSALLERAIRNQGYLSPATLKTFDMPVTSVTQFGERSYSSIFLTDETGNIYRYSSGKRKLIPLTLADGTPFEVLPPPRSKVKSAGIR
jgi:alpha-tubulin suppressor-like RCC1 family protein